MKTVTIAASEYVQMQQTITELQQNSNTGFYFKKVINC